jgi:hypothetical protein
MLEERPKFARVSPMGTRTKLISPFLSFKNPDSLGNTVVQSRDLRIETVQNTKLITLFNQVLGMRRETGDKILAEA